MKKQSFFYFLFIISSLGCFAQNFTSYTIGNSTDLDVPPLGGVCLMGGATEDDNAMQWFLQQANGGASQWQRWL